ncbi:MAG: Crp/Fnr family transcriptional regulator [Clostridia bacterium]|nr:Crp/Fnr family transcriptional regulator [Clostridia bacterium]
MQSVISKKSYTEALKKCILFENIPRENYDAVIAFLNGNIKHYYKDETIAHIDSTYQSVGLVLSGEVEIYLYNADYERVAVNRFSCGQLFGEYTADLGLKESPVEVIAMNECDILFMDLSILYHPEQFGEHRELAAILSANYIHNLKLKNMHLSIKVRILSQKSLRNRIYLFLCICERDEQGYITLPFSKTALAEHLAVNRSALSRELGRMQKDGVITMEGKKIKIIRTTA